MKSNGREEIPARFVLNQRLNFSPTEHQFGAIIGIFEA
jgi:hypothetical protein